MPLTLPNLDDRRWADLVDEGRALIPLYAPGWTDHNVHDPGVTLVELLAWIAEMDVYRVNRIPASRRRKFLSLVGGSPAAPRGSRTVVAFTAIGDEAAGDVLPAGLEVQGSSESGGALSFQLTRSMTVAPGCIEAILLSADGRWEDAWPKLSSGRDAVPPWGAAPQEGSTLLIGLSHPLPPGATTTLYFVADESPENGSDDDRRRRRRGPHHSVRLAWEYLAADGWIALEAGAVRDDTRALTQSGGAAFRIDGAMTAAPPPSGGATCYWIRCRYLSGAYDATPRLRRVLLNAVEARQVCEVTDHWATEPGPVGGLAAPSQRRTLPTSLADGNRVRVAVAEHGGERLRVWRQRPDFLDSDKRDAHFTLDGRLGELTFGDGDRGRALPAEA